MKREYDFPTVSAASFIGRTRRCRRPFISIKGAVVSCRAGELKGVEIGELVNQMLKHDIDLVETMR
jgi:hypothetical protein